MSQQPEAAQPPIVRARRLRKDYGSGEGLVRAVDEIDLEVAPGEAVAVMGPSGCGKSTLLHLLGGLDRPDAGELTVCGQRLDRLSERGPDEGPVPHRDHPVGGGRDPLVVRHHDQRQAVGAKRLKQSQHLKRGGRACRGERPASSAGSSTFSCAVSSSIRWNAWKTGARASQVTTGLVTAQVLSALPGAIVGIPLGLALYEVTVANATQPPAGWIVAAAAGALAVIGALTVIPALIGGRQPVSQVLAAETA